MVRRRGLILGLLLGALAAIGPARAEPARFVVAYEAIPSADLALPAPRAAGYAAKERLARLVAVGLTPSVVAAVGLDPGRVFTRIAPGGYLGETAPALFSTLHAAPADADRLAAALGYVLRQDSVLVADLDGDGAYQVSIRFAYRALTPATAQAFFRRAMQVHPGLGGGYMALDDRMVFLNLRGPDGRPYSGLADWPFREMLGIAASRFDGARLGSSGQAAARLIANDWKRAPNGSEYAGRLAGATAALDALAARFEALLQSAAKRVAAN